MSQDREGEKKRLISAVKGSGASRTPPGTRLEVALEWGGARRVSKLDRRTPSPRPVASCVLGPAVIVGDQSGDDIRRQADIVPGWHPFAPKEVYNTFRRVHERCPAQQPCR